MSSEKKKTTRIVVEYVIVQEMVMQVDPTDVDYQVEIAGRTLGACGASNYKDSEDRYVSTKKIAYQYSKSGVLT